MVTLEEIALRQRNKLHREFLAADPQHAQLEERELRAKWAKMTAAEPARLAMSHLAYEWTGIITSGIF